MTSENDSNPNPHHHPISIDSMFTKRCEMLHFQQQTKTRMKSFKSKNVQKAQSKFLEIIRIYPETENNFP